VSWRAVLGGKEAGFREDSAKSLIAFSAEVPVP
jgi:hypothetical protein